MSSVDELWETTSQGTHEYGSAVTFKATDSDGVYQYSECQMITYINQFSRGHMGTTWTGTVNVKSWEAHETQENKQATGEEDEITELNDTLQWKLEDGVLTTPHGSYKKPENSSL
eukprot:TRINITY_DN3728_c0_g1_i1.p1 TRINITY_DN3728_c0_g1~~TRINITY_DN3728_c0_g1_i1.p1  ORF type:complete len:115 (-),score=34.85 TRINITY_DN3728_c0_g1_i1:70-414(-)